MIRNLAVLISLAVSLSASFAQSAEAKTSRNCSGSARSYLVPPPPPYIPSMVPSGMTYAQAVTADDTVEKEAKTSRNSSRIARNCLVPPPPPYIPTLVPSALGMACAQAVTANDAVMEKQVNPYSQYIITRGQGDILQVSFHRDVQTKILKQIDSFDSEISSHEKEIGKLLNL